MVFHIQEFEKLSEFIQKYYHATLSKRDMSLRGWNWGVADFVGECTLFKIIACRIVYRVRDGLLGFRPAGPTHCTDEGEIWHGGVDHC